MVQVVQAAVAFDLFEILCCFTSEELPFAELFTHILSRRLELKSFILLLCLLSTIDHYIKDIAFILREKCLAPNTTTILDCLNDCESCIQFFINSYDRRADIAHGTRHYQDLPF